MQKINLRDLYPDAYKTDVFVDVAEEVLTAIRDQQQDDAAYERRKFRHKAYYSLNREDGIENDALNQNDVSASRNSVLVKPGLQVRE